MTREDLLNGVAMQVRFHTISGKSFPDTIDAIGAKVDEYAKQQEFEFAQWASHSDWVYLPSKKMWHNEEDEENITPKTTEQLYELFTSQSQ